MSVFIHAKKGDTVQVKVTVELDDDMALCLDAVEAACKDAAQHEVWLQLEAQQ